MSALTDKLVAIRDMFRPGSGPYILAQGALADASALDDASDSVFAPPIAAVERAAGVDQYVDGAYEPERNSEARRAKPRRKRK